MTKLTAAEMKLLSDPRLVDARRALEKQCEASRAHSLHAAAALKRYGNHGADISGCVRGHFPDDVKDLLRGLARIASRGDEYANRPKGIHRSTILALARAVATCDGFGFYGPQGRR